VADPSTITVKEAKKIAKESFPQLKGVRPSSFAFVEGLVMIQTDTENIILRDRDLWRLKGIIDDAIERGKS